MKASLRLPLALLASLLLHALLIAALYAINLPTNPPLKKVKLENLLVLKRGQSQDPTREEEGARRPSLAARKAPIMPASRPSQSTPIPLRQSNATKKPMPQEKDQTKKQEDSQKKSLESYDPNHFDPKNLSFLDQAQEGGIQYPQNQQNSQEDDKGRDPQTIQEINELYGEEFGDLGTAQKDFIKNNLKNIGRITQQYLRYPRVAAYFEQSGVNAVEFYLHPNGDITDLKIIKSSGLNSFDAGTLNTIRLAYKDYPRPAEKTLIRIHVTYSYWGY